MAVLLLPLGGVMECPAAYTELVLGLFARKYDAAFREKARQVRRKGATAMF
jgi:hypothetical protein